MKLTNFRKGFTLVEIMIVVVIIGILATLAVPAYRKIRNGAVEKAIINDGRLLANGANTVFSENPGTASVTFQDLVGPNKFIPSLSTGNWVASGNSATSGVTDNTTAILYNTAIAGAVAYFTVGNPNYQTDLSSNIGITSYYTTAVKALVFDTASGKVCKPNGTAL